MTDDRNASAKLALVAFTAFMAGVALTGLFVWLDPFHVLRASDHRDFRTYRDHSTRTPAADDPTSMNAGPESDGDPPASTQRSMPSSNAAKSSANPPDGHDHGSVAYTCGVHPEVTESAPGFCPICNRQLNRVDPEQAQATPG